MKKKLILPIIFALTLVCMPTEAQASTYDDEIDLIGRMVIAEAEGESEYGQRLVIDTILNRMDDDHFPDNVEDVIYEKGQFTSAHNGRLDRCKANDYILDLVREEWDSRTDPDVLFFNTAWIPGTKKLFKEGHHYFSTLKEEK